MKIWKAELMLFYTDEDKWTTKFKFKSDDKEYEINNKFDEWNHCEDWIMDRIPMNMCIEGLHTLTNGFKVVQGFDRELSAIELFYLRNQMIVMMEKQLKFQKEKYLKEWDEKLRAICGV